MKREHLALASALLTACCVVPYLLDIRRGVTRPHRTSWFVFAVLATVAAVSQAISGADAGAWLAAGSAIGFSAVFAASIRHGVGGTSTLDRLTLVVAGVGTVAWLVSDRPLLAVVGVVGDEKTAPRQNKNQEHKKPPTKKKANMVN